MEKKLWAIQQLQSGSEVHVHPLNDLIEHTPHECVCGPRTEPVPRSDGSVGWIIIHASLDGREQQETQS